MSVNVEEKMISVRKEDYDVIKELSKSEDRSLRGVVSQMVKLYQTKNKKKK